MAFAVLKTLKKDFDARDIVAARLLVRKNTREVGNMQAPSSCELSVESGSTPSESLELGQATLPGHPPATGADIRPTSTRIQPPPILVTLSNRPLMLEIIRKKVEFGKLHSSKIAPNLPSTTDHTSFVQGLININEFLP